MASQFFQSLGRSGPEPPVHTPKPIPNPVQKAKKYARSTCRIIGYVAMWDVGCGGYVATVGRNIRRV